MRLSFTGTRSGMTDQQKDRFRALLRSARPSALVHGCCMGADDEADLIAAEEGVLRIGIPSDHPVSAMPRKRFQDRGGSQFVWAPTGPGGQPKPPLDRNEDIVKAGDALVAAPKEDKEIGRSGTWHAVRQARKAKHKPDITFLWPDGRVHVEWGR